MAWWPPRSHRVMRGAMPMRPGIRLRWQAEAQAGPRHSRPSEIRVEEQLVDE